MADRVIMFLNGSKYFLDSVLKIGKSGLKIHVAEDNLNTDAMPEHVVTLSRSFQELDDESIIFYKQHGKYTVLSGKNKVAEAKAASKYKGEVLGHLVTSVALKRARIDDAPVVEEPVKSYSEEFRNSPRPYEVKQRKYLNRTA